MEGDRGAVLLIQAVVRGLIDFKDAKLLDRKWWFKLNLLLDGLEHENHLKMLYLHHSQHTSCLSIPDNDIHEHHWKEASTISTSVYNILFPYFKSKTEQRTSVDKLKEKWKEIWGDWTDPDVKERLTEWEKSARETFVEKPKKQKPRRVRKYGW